MENATRRDPIDKWHHGMYQRCRCLKPSYELQQINELTAMSESDGKSKLTAILAFTSNAPAMRNVDVVVTAALLLAAGPSGIHASSRLRGAEDAIVVPTSGSSSSDAEMPRRKNTSSRRLRTSSISNDAVVSSNVGNSPSEAQVDADPYQTGGAADKAVTVEYADASAYVEFTPSTLPDCEVPAVEPAADSVINATGVTPVRTLADPVTPPVLAKFNSVSSTGIESGASAGSSEFDGESFGGRSFALEEVASRPKSGVSQARQAQQLDALLSAMDSRSTAFGRHGQPLHVENFRFFGEMAPRGNYLPPFQVPRASRRQLQRYAEL
jgi:hypothetical protein